MTFSRGLLAARHHFAFLTGLSAAFGLVIWLETVELNLQPPAVLDLQVSEFDAAAQRTLADKELAWARIAWRYFENNTQPETGLVNSVDGYTASTMWDTASYLLGMISAYELGVIDDATFDQRMRLVLTSLGRLPLFDGKLPNKSYNTVTLAMVDYQNNPTSRGIGWSAIDVGRVLVPLNIIVWKYPKYTDSVQTILQSWDLTPMLRDGVMFGSAVDDQGKTALVQEGRIGYEEYAAKTLAMMGYDVTGALQYVDFLEYVDVYDIDIPTDKRNPEKYHAHNYIVSESWMLDGMEFGWDFRSREFAWRVYAAQEARYKDTGILTAVSEDNIDEPPYFVYNTVFTSGKIWNAITDDGTDASEFKTLSTKAAFGWHALYESEYTELLMAQAELLHDPEKGWYSGYYEVLDRPNKALTANTNGIILESLAYKQFGPLINSVTRAVDDRGMIAGAADANTKQTMADAVVDQPAQPPATSLQTAPLPPEIAANPDPRGRTDERVANGAESAVDAILSPAGNALEAAIGPAPEETNTDL